MTVERATRRYFALLVPAMLVFISSTLGIVWADDTLTLPAAAPYVLTVVPIAALLSTYWALWRFITEIDEFLRLIQIKSIIIGLIAVTMVITGWGLMELYADAPALGIFWLNPLFWVAYAIAALIITKRDGGVC
ncbi:MAG: hypothetical protein AAGG65_02705 [Pseudomonadota bacterium]